jgi:recombination protein RecA
MSVAALRSLLETRWHGPAVYGHAQAAQGLSTGSADLDRALGGVGIPKGRLTEAFGERSCGKTTLAYGLLAVCTAQGDIGAFLDPERSFFAPAAESAGVVLDRLIVVRPRDAAAYRRAADALVRSSACSIVVIDGANDETLQTHHYARLVAQAEKTSTTLFALSHGRSQSLASFATLRIRLHDLAPLWQSGDRLAGYRISCDIVKSRLSPPGHSAAFDSLLAEVVGSWPVSPARDPAERFEHVCAR